MKTIKEIDNKNIVLNFFKDKDLVIMQGAMYPLIFLYNIPSWVERGPQRYKEYFPLHNFIDVIQDEGNNASFAYVDFEYTNSAKLLFENFDKLESIFKEFEHDKKLFLNLVEELNDSPKDIVKRFKEFLIIYCEMYSSGGALDGFLNNFSENLINEIKEKFPSLIDEIPRLVEPTGITFTQNFTKDILESVLDLNNLTKEEIRQKHHFIHNNYKKTTPLSIEYVEEEFSLFEKKSSEELAKELLEITSSKDKSNPGFTETIYQKLTYLGEISHTIDQRKMCNLIGNYWISEYIRLKCEEKNLDYNNVVYLTVQEFESVLNDSSKITDYDIEERKKCFAFCFGAGVLDSCTGKRAKEYLDLIEDEIEDTNELKGQTACNGIVKGKVRLCIHSNIPDFEDGDILVTSMTRPDFVPLMKKASAIITNEGGVTCHAAIVSRELKKPCIIGTKIATKILKDGDLVEVDADKGIVTIISRKNENI